MIPNTTRFLSYNRSGSSVRFESKTEDALNYDLAF
jgi:hypothetical protein